MKYRFLLIIITLICLPAVLTAQEETVSWWEEAHLEDNFLQLMNSADKKQFEDEFEPPFLVLMEEEGKKAYKKVKDIEGRKEYLVRFIREVNENPLLPVNFWLVEFTKRYRIARTQFKTDKKPYFDVRGEFYLRYGKPYYRFTDAGGVKFVKASAGQITYRLCENESWYYRDRVNNFIVHFGRFKKWFVADELEDLIYERGRALRTLAWTQMVKDRGLIAPHYGWLNDEVDYLESMSFGFGGLTMRDLRRDVTMFNDFEQAMFNSFALEKTYKNMAEENVSTVLTEISQIDFHTHIAQFRNVDGRTRMQLTFMAPVQNLLDMLNPKNMKIVNKWVNPAMVDTMNVEFQFMIRDSSFTPVVRAPIANKVSIKQMERAGFSNIMSMVTFPVRPIDGDMTVQVRDLDRHSQGFTKVPLEIRDFSGDEPMISDLQFYMEIRDEEAEKILPSMDVQGVKIAPYPFEKLRKYIPVFCYFELYNLEKAGFGPGYQIEIKSSRLESNWLKKLGARAFNSEDYNIAMTYNRDINGDDSAEMIALDVSGLRNGRYVFTVTISDSKDKDKKLTVERTMEVTQGLPFNIR